MGSNNIAPLLRQFNETIDTWIGKLDGYTFGTLCRKPQPDSWSLGQVYVHIIGDTRFYLEQMEAAAADRDNADQGMNETARHMFAANAFPDRLLTNPANEGMPQPHSKETLFQELTSIKEKVNKLFLTWDPSMTHGKTQHPGFLFFSAAEWLQFADMHMRHHLRQKERIDAQLKKIDVQLNR